MEVEQLINIVHDNSPLWDINNPLYHSRDIQRKLWKNVAQELGANVVEVKKKWKGLRDTFRRECRKIFEYGEEVPEDMHSSWTYFNQLKFLTHILRPKSLRRHVRFPIKISSSEKMKQADGGDDSPPDEEDEEEEEEEDQQSNFVDSQQGSFNDDPGDALWAPAVKKIKLRRSMHDTNVFENDYFEVEKAKMEMFSEKESVNYDSDYQFLVSLYPFLQQVPPNRKLVVRNRLQQVFIDEEEEQRHTS